MISYIVSRFLRTGYIEQKMKKKKKNIVKNIVKIPWGQYSYKKGIKSKRIHHQSDIFNTLLVAFRSAYYYELWRIFPRLNHNIFNSSILFIIVIIDKVLIFIPQNNRT